MGKSDLCRVLLGLAVVGWVSEGAAQFVAFNDHVGGSATHSNATVYNVFRSGGITNAGWLKNITDGALTAVTLTITNRSASSTVVSGLPNPGTPAHETFNDYVTFGNGAILVGTGQSVGHVLTGLDPNKLYSLKGTAVRGATNDRWTVFELVGALAFNSAHTAGCHTGNTNASIASNQVVLCTGDNRPGDLFDWENVVPGPGGTLAVLSRKFTNALAGITNGPGSATACEALRVEELTTQQPPQLLLQPQDGTVFEGDSVVLTASGYGTVPLFYQWLKNGIGLVEGGRLIGVNGATFTLSNVQAGDAGGYSVLITNNAGAVTSRVAVLRVRAARGSTWVAFNDHVSGSATHLNATFYNVFKSLGTTNAGLLKNITNGTLTPVTLTLTNDRAAASSLSGVPNPGTAAYETFNNYVTFSNGAVLMGSGQSIGHVLTGLDPNRLYSIKGTAVRGATNDRWSMFELVGAMGFTSAHTVGCYTGNTNASIASNQVVLCTGDNRQGDLFDWENVVPSPDGTLAIVSRKFTNAIAGLTNGTGSAAACEALRVEEIAAAQPPQFSVQPQDTTIYEAQPVSLDGRVYGTPPLFCQWFKEGLPLPHATNSSYALSHAAFSDAGSYALRVTNLYGSVTSQVVRLIVKARPSTVVLTDLWRYNQSGADLGTAWKEVAYDDSAWPQGQGVLALADDPLVTPLTNTILSLTNPAGQRITTYYFRTHFFFSNDPAGMYLCFSNLIDDGCVVYLNGFEHYRLNLTNGLVNASWLATEATEGLSIVTNLYPLTHLVRGDNVLAVEVHQSATNSPDVVMGLSVSVQTPNPPSVQGAVAALVSMEPTSSLLWPTGTTESGFTAASDDAMAPWGGRAVQFRGTGQPGGNSTTLLNGASLIYRYRLEFALPVVIDAVSLSGAAFNGPNSVGRLLDAAGNAISTCPTVGGNSYRRFAWTPPSAPGTVFFLDEYDRSGWWRYRDAITVHATPAVLPTALPLQPVLQQGQSLLLSVSTASPIPLSYQWQFNGTNLAGATSATLGLNTVQPAQAGAYSVIAGNAAGSVTSLVARITVQPDHSVGLVPLTQVWRYNQDGADLGTSWKDLDYDDSAWAAGAGVLAVEDNTLVTLYTNTILSLTNATGQRVITYYFRTHFKLTNDPATVYLTATNLLDDGAVVYLNGLEVYRARVPAGQSFQTLAGNQPDEGVFEITSFPPAALRPGDNVLAAEVHQTSPSSSDLVFGLSLSAQPTNGGPPVILSPPGSQTVNAGAPVTLSAAAVGESPLTFQWRLNGQDLPAATNAVLSFPDVRMTHDGFYSVRVRNAFGMALSAPVRLSVNTPGNRPFYSTGFEAGAGLEWSVTKTELTPANPTRFLGQFANQSLNLNLTNLPPHLSATVTFDLLILQTWNGNGLTEPEPGPDHWSVRVTGGPVLCDTTFTGYNGGVHQAFPDPYPGGDYPALTGASETNTLGYVWSGEPMDSVYRRLSYSFAHTGDSLQLVFTGSNLQGIGDESWGLDNVSVTLAAGSPTPWCQITRPPQEAVTNAGETVVFSVAAAGLEPLAYQWRLNGTNLTGATNSRLTVLNVQTNQSGRQYSVAVNSTFGAVTSDAATLTVLNLAPGWNDDDVAQTGRAGSANFTNGLWTVRGAGEDIAGSADAFQFTHRALTGDGQIIARLVSLQGSHPQAEAGVMLRTRLDPGAQQVLLAANASRGTFFRRRLADNTESVENGQAGRAPCWLRLMRLGNTFVGHLSTNGVNWDLVWFTTVDMPDTVEAGLAVCSHLYGTLATATFENVSVGPLTPLSGPWPLPTPRVYLGGESLGVVDLQSLGGFKMLIGGSVGDRYVVEGSSHLPYWTNLANPTNLFGVVEYLDPGALGTNQRFYRVRTLGP